MTVEKSQEELLFEIEKLKRKLEEAEHSDAIDQLQDLCRVPVADFFLYGSFHQNRG